MDIEKEIEAIKQRNLRVEADKAPAFAKASADKKWKREIAAGGVVYTDARSVSRLKRRDKKEQDKLFILLIMPKGPNYGPPVGYWTFPKGLLDKDGEDKEQVALREVREEAGVEAEIKEPLGMVKFFRKSEQFGNVIKFVHFWLMKYKSGDLADHDEEVAEAKWFEISEVLNNLKFQHDKEIFEKAKKALDQ